MARNLILTISFGAPKVVKYVWLLCVTFMLQASSGFCSGYHVNVSRCFWCCCIAYWLSRGDSVNSVVQDALIEFCWKIVLVYVAYIFITHIHSIAINVCNVIRHTRITYFRIQDESEKNGNFLTICHLKVRTTLNHWYNSMISETRIGYTFHHSVLCW